MISAVFAFTDISLKILILECSWIFEGKCIAKGGKYISFSIVLFNFIAILGQFHKRSVIIY